MIEIATSTLDTKHTQVILQHAKVHEMKFQSKKLKERDIIDNKRRIATIESRRYLKYINKFDKDAKKYIQKKEIQKKISLLKCKVDIETIKRNDQIFQSARYSNPYTDKTKQMSRHRKSLSTIHSDD